MAIQFAIDGELGIFYLPDCDAIIEQFHNTIDLYDDGKLSDKNYMSSLMELINQSPDFIDGHAHIGFALLDQGKSRKALDACLRGVSIGESVMPEDFDGHVEWSSHENRPFLRAMHGAVLCYLQLRQRRNAVRLMEKMLKWNPNDNQGVRFLIGSEYLRLGEIDQARSILEKEAEYFPPYQYELALLHLKSREWIPAATSLRRGFAANGYIAEFLIGHLDPHPLAIWHGSSFLEPETALDYVQRYGALWRRSSLPVSFLRWVHNHSRVLAERAAVQECMEELLWERDFDKRRVIVQRQDELLDGIDDRLSAEIVVKRQDRDGRAIYPWQYAIRASRFS